MAVKIRLKRMGKIRQPYYRIVVVDSRRKRDGRVIEEIGKYHPKEDPSFIEVTSERAQYWLGVGAQPTEAVAVILKVTGDWQRFKGLPGAEGTLKTAAAKRDKTEIFNEALKEAGGEPKAEAVTSKATAKKARAKSADVATVAPEAEPAPVAPTEATAATTEEAATVSTDESGDTTPTEAAEDLADAGADADADTAADAEAGADAGADSDGTDKAEG